MDRTLSVRLLWTEISEYIRHEQKYQFRFIMNRNLTVQIAWTEISVYIDYRQKYQRQISWTNCMDRNLSVRLLWTEISEYRGMKKHNREINSQQFDLFWRIWFTRRYSPLHGLTSSFCGGLRLLAEAFLPFEEEKKLFTLFVLILVHFRCSVVTSILFSSNLRHGNNLVIFTTKARPPHPLRPPW